MMENQRPLFLLEEKLTYKLIGIFIQISKEHSFFYKEHIYHKLIINTLKKYNINFVFQPKIAIYNINDGKQIGNFYPDFVIENKIIIEIKSQNQISNNHVNQLIKYLSASEYEIGLLVNFGTPKIQIIRRIYTNDRKPFLSLITHREAPSHTG